MTFEEALKMLREKAKSQHDNVSLIYLDSVEQNWKKLDKMMGRSVFDMDLRDINQIDVVLEVGLSNLGKVTRALGVPFYRLIG